MEQLPSGLRRFPPEIRNMIYEHAVLLRHSSLPSLSLEIELKYVRPGSRVPTLRQVPSLLATLRTAPDLYQEALEVFYKVNTFILDLDSFQSFCGLKAEIVKLIRDVTFDLRTDSASKDVARDFSRLFTYSQSNLASATGIRKVLIMASYEEPLVYSLIDNGVTNWRKLQAFTMLAEHLNPKEEQLETQMLDYIGQYFKFRENTKDWKMEQLGCRRMTTTGWNWNSDVSKLREAQFKKWGI